MKAKHPEHLPFLYTSDIRSVSSNSPNKLTHQTTPQLTFAEILQRHKSNTSVRFFNSVLERAASASANYVYIEPEETVLRVRYRASGELKEEVISTDENVFDITELLAALYENPEAPLDFSKPSSLSAKLGTTDFDLTMMPLRTAWGPSLTVAINKSLRFAPMLDELEIPHFTLQQLRDILDVKAGFLLLAGPIASETQLTRLAILQALNTPNSKIISIEQNSSLTLPRVCHVPLIGDTDSKESYVHYLLRQAPDICSVDHLQQSNIFTPLLNATLNNTKLIASTHASSAIEALLQLKAHGYNKHIVAQSLLGVLTQRSVSKVCPNCKRVQHLSSLDKKWIQQNFPGEVIVEGSFTIGEGCNSCADTGLDDTCTIYELVGGSEELSEAILEGDKNSLTTAISLRNNFQTLKQKAFSLASSGIIPLHQVVLIQQ